MSHLATHISALSCAAVKRLAAIYLVEKLPRFQFNVHTVTMKSLDIKVRRGSQGLGLSLIYRGRDKFDRRDTGLYISQVVPGGAAMRAGLRKGDKILSINKKSPKKIEEAIEILKKAKTYIELVVERPEEKVHHSKGKDDVREILGDSQQTEDMEADRAERASDLSSKRMSIR